MQQKTKVVVLGVVRNNHGEILLSQRFEPVLPEVHLKWELPGGTIEFGESPIETVVREVAEETGLQVQVKRLLPVCHSKVWNYPDHQQHTLILGFECELLGGELTTTDHKVSSHQWVSVTQAQQADLLEGTEKFLGVLEELEKID